VVAASNDATDVNAQSSSTIQSSLASSDLSTSASSGSGSDDDNTMLLVAAAGGVVALVILLLAFAVWRHQKSSRVHRNHGRHVSETKSSYEMSTTGRADGIDMHEL